ncbi:MAG: hypothetical protein MZU97_16280 [Bacillus subtilis]|nr:hypothetical protein [Bacillus subtilis]
MHRRDDNNSNNGTGGTGTTTATTGSTSTTVTTTTALQRLQTPTGLSIAGTVLSWNPVTGATGYAVYVNDVFQANTTATTYNFSALSGTQLLFRVVAKAPTTGILIDSLQSASIAYQTNAAAEIEAINGMLDGFIAGGSTGFAAELVNKGMTAEEFQAFKTAVETFQQSLPEDNNLNAANAALTTLLSIDTNIEALISGMMITLDEQMARDIDSLNHEMEVCQEYIDVYDNEWMCDRPMSSIESEKATVEMMIELLAAEKEQMVLVATNAAEYFIDLQSHLSNTLLTNLQALMESEGELNTSEIVVIKNEIVQMLLDNMPPVEDTTLLFQLFASMFTTMTSFRPSATPSTKPPPN